MLGLVFWWQALTPTFIPRPWTVRAAISGCCLAIGYGIGTLIGRGVQRHLDRCARSPGPAARRRIWVGLGIVWVVSVLVGGALWARWQNEQRDFMGMELVGWRDAVLGALLVGLGHLVASGAGAFNRFAGRHLPVVLAAPATILLLVVVGIVAFRVAIGLAESNYSSVNDTTDEGVVPPDSPSVSGSSESLVAWAHRASVTCTGPTTSPVGRRSCLPTAGRGLTPSAWSSFSMVEQRPKTRTHPSPSGRTEPRRSLVNLGGSTLRHVGRYGRSAKVLESLGVVPQPGVR
jgi:uncharacterized membrane protein